MIPPLVAAAGAGGLAAIAVSSWIAVGSVFIRDDEVTALHTAWALIIGCALGSTVLAILAARGFAWQGALAAAVVGAIVLAVRRARTLVLVRGAYRSIETSLAGDRFSRIAVLALLVLLLVYAAAPPRDGDVIRYHLAHIRQIAAENSWHWVPDVTYALPLAWSLNYLPFELIGLPQGAAMLNVVLWVVLFAVLLEVISLHVSPAKAVALSLCLLAHPFIVKTFSAAFADPFAMLLTCTVAAGLMRLDRLSRRDIAFLGFASWVGIGSRYQMVAIAIPATAVVLYSLAREKQWRGMRPFVLGSALAVALSSPGYLMNWKGIGNPVWPLFPAAGASPGSYATLVAEHFSARFTHVASVQTFRLLLVRLFTESYLFPLPLLLILLVVIAAVVRKSESRRLAAFGGGFLLLWVRMSPGIYPTHILPVLCLIPILAAPFLAGRRAITDARQTLFLRALAAIGIVLSAAFSYDYLRYDMTGDAATYHRFTWYYPVYDWVNHHTPPESRSLVVVYSGISYYLDRPYRRADPWLSPEVDWTKVRTGADLDAIMARKGFDYLIYDDMDWSSFPGGVSMMAAIKDGVARKTLAPVFHSREKLYSGRVTRRYSVSDVYVFKRAAGLKSRPIASPPSKSNRDDQALQFESTDGVQSGKEMRNHGKETSKSSSVLL